MEARYQSVSPSRDTNSVFLAPTSMSWMREKGGTLPEDLPLEPPIAEVKKRLLSLEGQIKEAQISKFEPVIERAMEGCAGTGLTPSNHFAQTSKMVELGSGDRRSSIKPIA